MPATGSRRPILYATVIVLGLVCLGEMLFLRWNQSGWVLETDEPDEPVPKSFSGKSEQLKATVILPTLDTPLPEGKSAIWCSSFQLAWNQLKNDIAKGPIQIQNAAAVAERLNRAKESSADLAPGSYYAAAGSVRDGICGRILREMAERFPDGPHPDLPSPPDGVVSYAYLKAGVRYKYPYFDNKKRFLFTSSSGKEAAVLSFGIRTEDTNKDDILETFRGQPLILFVSKDRTEFAVDVCKHSEPNQLVLARLPRRSTLVEMASEVQSRGTGRSSLGFEDTLLIPTMHWRVEHRFTELEGQDKLLLNPSLRGLYSAIAWQTLDFKMDRKGAEVASEAGHVWLNGGPHHYHFDRPFLIYLRKRDAKYPFFVMWVDNAELLCRM